MENLVAILVPIACGCILPIFGIWMGVRQKMNETNSRTQVVLAAIEKNPDVDVEDLIKKMAPKQKLLKEKLLTRLLWGGITGFLGIALIGYCVCGGYVGGMPTKDLQGFSLIGAVLLAIGIAFLVNYFVGKRMLTKEMEAEQAKKLEQA